MAHNCAGFEMSHNLRIRDLTFFVPAAVMPNVQRADTELGEHSGYLTSWNEFFFSLRTPCCSDLQSWALKY